MTMNLSSQSKRNDPPDNYTQKQGREYHNSAAGLNRPKQKFNRYRPVVLGDKDYQKQQQYQY